MYNIGDIVMVRKELKDSSELYDDFQGAPLEITEIIGNGHKDYESTSNESLYAFKTEKFEVKCTLYDSELEIYSV